MILVTGGAGVIGSALVRGLLERGHQVRALALPDTPAPAAWPTEAELCFGDIRSGKGLKQAFEGVRAVYHLAAVLLCEHASAFYETNVEGTRHTLEAAQHRGVEHFVHVSSASVVYPVTTPYSRSKRAAERLVARAPGLATTIVRPTLVYDGEGGLEFRVFAQYLRSRRWAPLPGDGRARKRPVHVDDLIAGLCAIAYQPQTYGQRYDLSGGETLSVDALAALVAERVGAKPTLLHLPEALCRLGLGLARALGRAGLSEHAIVGLTQDAILDNPAAQRDFGYAPRGMRDGLGLAPLPPTEP